MVNFVGRAVWLINEVVTCGDFYAYGGNEQGYKGCPEKRHKKLQDHEFLRDLLAFPIVLCKAGPIGNINQGRALPQQIYGFIRA